MMLQDSSELRQPLAKETVPGLTGVRVSVTDDVGVELGDSQIAVYPAHFQFLHKLSNHPSLVMPRTAVQRQLIESSV